MSQKTIFIVDDQELNLLLVKKALENDYRTYAIPSIEKMFNLTEKIQPDLIILDIEMPNIDGFEAMELLKKSPQLKYVPVIFLTARIDPESEIIGFDLGAADFIYKPFSVPVLNKRVAAHLAMSQLIKSIREKNEELMKIHESRSNILSMISHDLKNYIGSINQAIEIINIKYQSFENNKYLKMIEDSAGKALLLVKDILSINKLDAETESMTLVQYNINDLIYESNENLILIAREKKINMFFEGANSPIICMINPEKMHRALDNLCINAIKFTKPEGTIIVKTQKQGNIGQISIIDSGIGIDHNMIAHLFEKFTTTGRTGTAGEASTGLGLYIVKQIIDLHQGSIEVCSEVGKGSEFMIKLPIVSSD